APGARATLDLIELVAELGDPIADPAAIELEGALACTLAADAAAHAVAAAGALAQPGRQVPQARDLDLQPGLAGPGMAVADLEGHGAAIEDVGAGGALEVALLGRGEIVVDQHDAGARRGTCITLVILAGGMAVASVTARGITARGITARGITARGITARGIT